MKKKWCSFDPGTVDLVLLKEQGIPQGKRPKNWFFRCPICNKRLLVQWVCCGDKGCYHQILSSHKEK